MTKWIHLATGSIAGGFARYFVAGAVQKASGIHFPYGTLVVNLSGCFLIGLFNSLSEEKFFLTPEKRMLLMVGFCGAFTTFSTFILETSNLAKNGEIVSAFSNIFLSVVFGFLLFCAGSLVGKWI